ncbi:MAG TPA: LptF/LptG family permease [Gemmatimonadaceae bacterium]|nr:LptF/LptG family permease [Gemmatimonadaceae bacterium]
MKIIHKYVLREHVGPLTFALSALTSLLLLNYVAKQFGNLVGKGLPMSVIGEFVYLSLPFTVAMTLPMSVLVATLYAFSRLAAENEITALKSTGVSLVRLLVPVLLSAAVLSVGMIAFNDRVLPAANHRLRTLQTDIARKKPTFGLREQVLNEVVPNQFVLRARHLDTDNRMREVTIYDFSDPLRRRSIYADSGEMAFAANGSDLLLTLHSGYMLEVPRDEPVRLQRLDFVKDYVRVEGVANQLEVTREETYKGDREMSVCELQNEISRYEQEYERAHAELKDALLGATREAITGIPTQVKDPGAPGFSTERPGAPAPRSKHFSLGRLYCDLVTRLSGMRGQGLALVPALHAAGLPEPQDTTRPRLDTVRGRLPDTTSPTIGTLAVPPSQDTGGGRPVTPSTPGGTPFAVPPSAERAPAPGLDTAAPPPVATRQMPVALTGTIESGRVRMGSDLREINRNAVELHKKFAISVACLVFVLVGAPIALRFPRGGVGLVIGASLVIFGIYYVGLIAGEALADRALLTPFWAMWAANILLTGAGVVLLLRMGRESATARGGDLAELLDVLRGVFRRTPQPEPRRSDPGPSGALPEREASDGSRGDAAPESEAAATVLAAHAPDGPHAPQAPGTR